jgi:hypothetical protein
MATDNIRRRTLKLIFAIAAVGITCPEAIAAEPKGSKTFVEIKVWVIEVETSKLSSVGLEWNAMKAPGDARLVDFLTTTAVENNLASVFAQPMISTISGRAASMELPGRKLAVTPTVIDENRICLEYRVEADLALDGKRQPVTSFETASKTELKSGEIQILSETRQVKRSDAGEKRETVLLTAVRASTRKF